METIRAVAASGILSYADTTLPHVVPMARNQPLARFRFGTLYRNVAAALIAGVWRRRSITEVRDRLAAMPPLEEAAVIAGVLALLFLLAVAAAQFGVIGLLAYLLAVVLIVN
jgi:hypothetical protein